MKKLFFALSAACLLAVAVYFTQNNKTEQTPFFTGSDNIALAEGGFSCRPLSNWTCFTTVYDSYPGYIYVM